MHLDPFIRTLVGTVFLIVAIGLVLRRLRQPQLIAYLIAGIVVGPDGLGLVQDRHAMAVLGEAGVVLLLFFLGMEMSLPRLIANWRVAIGGTAAQVGLSVALVLLLGAVFDWPVARSVLLGFVISLSSTAMLIPLLQARGELDAPIGHDVVGVLLVQDMAVVPMLIAIGYLGGASTPLGTVVLQAIGAVAILGLLVWLVRGGVVRLPLARVMRDDHQLQIFAALALCFGAALATSLLGLSAAVGAFVGGIIVAAAKETEWVRDSLEPFHVVLLAVFFASVGMILDLDFAREQAGIVALLVGLALLVNTVVNAAALRGLGRPWRHARYGGALLAQIGEFSFVLAAAGLQAAVITDYGYQLTVAVIGGSLLLSPVWIGIFRPRPGRIGRPAPDPGSHGHG